MQARAFRARETHEYSQHKTANSKVLARKERKNLVKQQATHIEISLTLAGTAHYHTSFTFP
jgi:hypothetical protein